MNQHIAPNITKFYKSKENSVYLETSSLTPSLDQVNISLLWLDPKSCRRELSRQAQQGRTQTGRPVIENTTLDARKLGHRQSCACHGASYAASPGSC
ncbi:hypothetical protein RRG08_016279 [Elysia crispata]|uniref:Uncharacterized protein n=1 Tax=Elysia crispata TaxID=231223 RepID=A0AAE1B7N3_9GAST|nr:hypothetical protein RRG08_016279 [Elysia crispata]